jgi:hypothetical protein
VAIEEVLDFDITFAGLKATLAMRPHSCRRRAWTTA